MNQTKNQTNNKTINVKKLITGTNTLIEKRDNIIREIKNLWRIIKLDNVTKKDAMFAYDGKACYKMICNIENDLIVVKLKIQAINMGIKNFKEFPSNSNYPTVFKLSSLKERDEQLAKIPTITKEKGKYLKENITRGAIENLRKETQLQIVKLQEAINNYNNNFEYEDCSEYLKSLIP